MKETPSQRPRATSSATADPAREGGPGVPADPERVPVVLRPRVERLKSLRSAWGAIAPSSVSADGQQIAEDGREINERLALLARAGCDPDEDALTQLDHDLERFAQRMRQIASGVPVPELRSSLPYCLSTNRRGVLDLLDVLLGESTDDFDSDRLHLAAIDYVITLLCTGGPAQAGGGVQHDPISLTPRLAFRCEHAEGLADPRLEEIESEFFAAATMDTDELRKEIQQRTLRSRKQELGASFFAPRVLRAIVTYNAALLERVEHEVWDSMDWGRVAGAHTRAETQSSVFESESLRSLAEALRWRAGGGEAEASDLSRVAWGLDLDLPDPAEKKRLLSPAVPSLEELEGSVILVGLICRSINVLAVELQAIGISPDELSETWVKELEVAIQAEIKTRITNHAYEDACVFSELKNKFLYAPLVDIHREQRGTPRPRADVADDASASQSEEAETRRVAEELATDALEQNAGPETKRETPSRLDLQLPSVPWKRVLPYVFLAISLAFFAFRIGGGEIGGGDLSGMNRDRLAQVSPYLIEGARNGEGRGSAFVGKLGNDWLELSVPDREVNAARLVETLRTAGMTQIMVYDRDGILRIQALGSQPIQLR